VEDLIVSLQSVPPSLVYLTVFAVAFIENLFPPSPSDLLVVFAGSLVGLGESGFVETLTSATLGTTLGFLVMYQLGLLFGHRIVAGKKLRFLPYEAIAKVDGWFDRYGNWIIVANRFLAGTRAVVAFFAGMSGLRIGPTIGLSFISALLWNLILVSSGYFLGNNWREIGFYLTTYAQVVTGVIVLVLLLLLIRRLTKSRRARKGG